MWFGGLSFWDRAIYGGRYDPITALGASLKAWWDADHLDLITKDGSNLVASWVDRVGALDVTQATGANKPTYSATGFNGRPVITFDGTADHLTGTVLTGLPVEDDPGEIWVLCDQVALAADATTRFAFGYGTGGVAAGARRAVARIVTSGTNRARADSGDGTNQRTASNTAVDFSGRHVVRNITTATGVAIAVDGGDPGAETAITWGTGTGNARIRIGVTVADALANYFNGNVAAVLVTGALTNGQAAQLAQWLNSRRGSL